MNITEFAALKVGDRVYNGITNSHGHVTSRERDGVKLAWGPPAVLPGAAPLEFFFSVQSNAWTHWIKDGEPGCPGLEDCGQPNCRNANQCLGGSLADYDKLASQAGGEPK